MNFKATIVDAINDALKEQKIGIYDLSKKTGITAVNLYRVIKGNNFSMLTLSKIIRVLDLEFFITTEDNVSLQLDKNYLNASYYIAEIAVNSLKENKITAKEIAHRADISALTLSKLLNYKNVTIDVMSRVLEVVGVTTTNA